VLNDLIAASKRGERCGEKISGMDSVLKKRNQTGLTGLTGYFSKAFQR
jgi:hypothetical protein